MQNSVVAMWRDLVHVQSRQGQFLWFATLPMEATLLWLPTMTVTSMHGGRALRMIS